MKVKILIVCLGNICRSPTAEAVLRTKVQQRGLDCIIDSAGTINHHQGDLPDQRARRAAALRGYRFDGIVSRPISAKDFEYFDFIFAADNHNLADLKALCPNHLQHKLSLFLSYGDSECAEIPDPYYGGDQGFEEVLDLIENASDHIIAKLVHKAKND
ncbi:low molecular weight protein-tyrosine-phosphatase [Psychromonas sp. MME2]|uniref:low molecular weight protein-tyrosine-phosphatase n=1 Tax=unclassified Psychromonas TaxID=2614957 RepID=UPI00339D0228